MKKRIVTMLLAAAVMASMSTSYAVFAEDAAATEETAEKDDAAKDDAADEKKDDAAEDATDEKKDDAKEADKDAADGDAKGVTEDKLPAKPEFEPNKDYDKYTVVEYTIEDIQADLVCTVSAKEDNSEFYLECNFYGDDQMVKATYDGKEFKVEEDKTGFMGGDAPAILQKAIEQDLWVYGDGAATDAAPADGELATADALPTEAQFEPNKDYDKYTVVEYTLEDIQADLVCTVSAKEDNSEFYLECNFYGDDQMTKTTYDGKEFKVEEDKTGFMGGDTPAILEKAIEQNIWVAIEK